MGWHSASDRNPEGYASRGPSVSFAGGARTVIGDGEQKL